MRSRHSDPPSLRQNPGFSHTLSQSHHVHGCRARQRRGDTTHRHARRRRRGTYIHTDERAVAHRERAEPQPLEDARWTSAGRTRRTDETRPQASRPNRTRGGVETPSKGGGQGFARPGQERRRGVKGHLLSRVVLFPFGFPPARALRTFFRGFASRSKKVLLPLGRLRRPFGPAAPLRLLRGPWRPMTTPRLVWVLSRRLWALGAALSRLRSGLGGTAR